MKKIFLSAVLLASCAFWGFASEEAAEATEAAEESSSEQVKPAKTAPNIAQLTSAILKESHKRQFSKRVRPDDFSFEDNRKVQAYLASIKDEKPAKREKYRVKFISTIKSNLIAICERNPYEGKIYLLSATRTGIVSMANPNVIVVKTRAGGHGIEFRWNKVKAKTLILMTEHYADARLKIKDKKELKKQRAAAFDQLLAAAIMADWYGDYSQAVRLARKASDLMSDNPKCVKRVESLFLD